DAATPLKAWRQYRFRVEVQADDPPGAPTVGTVLPGAWSQASAPATVLAIPPAGPLPAATVQVANVGGALQVTVTHPGADTLIGTSMGPHRFEVWRIEPGVRPARHDIAFARGAGNTWVGADSGAPLAPAGSYVTVRIIDPIGRASDATMSNQI